VATGPLKPLTIRHSFGVVCPMRRPPRRKKSKTVARATRAHANRDCVRRRTNSIASGAASDLEAFSRQPTGLASRHRPSDRALYHMPEPAVPLVLNRITIAMRSTVG